MCSKRTIIIEHKTMFLFKSVFVLILCFYHVNCAVLIWSNEKFPRITALQQFTDEEFTDIVNQLNNPNVFVYKATELHPKYQELLKGYHKSYSPNGYINIENATDLDNDKIGLSDIKNIQQEIEGNGSTFLSALIITPKLRRGVRDTNQKSEEQVLQPVVYIGKSKIDSSYGILYSSKPIILEMNSTNITLNTAPEDMISSDTIQKDKYSRLNINIPLDEGKNKIMLRFIFGWLNRYWTLSRVVINVVNDNLSSNLTLDDEKVVINAPINFSYHCPGQLVFSDLNKEVRLYVSNLQVQISARDRKFNDAYSCINFMSAPIWSGIFVVFLLSIVLAIGITAILDIKTMDRFDNQKTKQLNFTVLGE